MNYYVSLVDNEQDVAKLEVAAKRMYSEIMLIKQTALCRLENEMPLATLLQCSYNISERLHMSMGKLIAKYSQPQDLVIDDCGGAVDAADIEQAISHNIALLKKAGENALDDILSGSDVAGLEGLNAYLTEAELDEVNSAGELFFLVVSAIFDKQAREFLDYVKENSEFTARVTDADADNPLGNAEVTVTLF